MPQAMCSGSKCENTLPSAGLILPKTPGPSRFLPGKSISVSPESSPKRKALSRTGRVIQQVTRFAWEMKDDEAESPVQRLSP